MIRLIKIFFLLTKLLLLTLIIKNKKTSNLNELKHLNIIHAKHIRLTLEKLGPIFIKFGQMLSTRIDIFSIEIINELKTLQTNTAHIAFKEIKTIIENDFNKKICQLFKKINENPLGSASIAQIHSAVSIDNEKVIIKVIKPHINKLIKKDIFLLKIISHVIHIFFKKLRRLKSIDIINELEITLFNEINLKNEAVNIIKMKNNFHKDEKIYIPNVNLKLTTKNILTLEYIDGINITNNKKFTKHSIDTNLLITNLLHMFYTQTFKHKFFHADLHPGNILVSKNNTNNPVLILLDFGIISSLKNNEKFYLSENLLAFAQRNYKKVAYLHIKAKTIQTTKSIKEIESELYFLFEPILNKKIKNISFKKTITSLINLSKNFNMQLQPNFILFQKTLLSIESISRQLNPSINLWLITRQSIESIIIKNLIKKNILENAKKLITSTSKQNAKNTYINYYKITIIIYFIIIIIIFFLMTYNNIVSIII